MTKRIAYDEALPIALLRARASTMRMFRPHLEQHGLTLPKWRVLRALAEGEPLGAGELADRCVILAPSLTRILKSLRGQGLITESPNDDARKHDVVITREGLDLFDRVFEHSLAEYKALEARMGTTKIDTLVKLLAELRDVADELTTSRN